MGILALIIGIASTFLVEFIPISVMKAFQISDALEYLPIFSIIGFIPATVGLILGIVDVVNKSKKGGDKSTSILGIILSTCSLAVILLFSIILLTISSESKIESMVSQRVEEYLEGLDASYSMYTEDEEYEEYEEDNENIEFNEDEDNENNEENAEEDIENNEEVSNEEEPEEDDNEED